MIAFRGTLFSASLLTRVCLKICEVRCLSIGFFKRLFAFWIAKLKELFWIGIPFLVTKINPRSLNVFRVFLESSFIEINSFKISISLFDKETVLKLATVLVVVL